MPEPGRVRVVSHLPCLLGLCLVLLAAACGTPQPMPAEPPAKLPPVEARAGVDRAVATTGDLITYTITVEHDPAYVIQIPEAGADIPGFRIVDIGREAPRQQDGRVIVERWYQLRADLVGSYVLPPITVTYGPAEAVETEVDTEVVAEEDPTGEAAGETVDEPAVDEQVVETSAIFIEVESVLPETGDATDIREIKPLQPKLSRIPWTWIIAGVALLLVLLVAARLLWRRHTRAIPPPPPHEVAFQALDALRDTDFDDPQAVRRFYFAISEVVRVYVEGRFGLNATDLTSDEIFSRLHEVDGLGQGPEGELRRFLAETDQVKFAAHRPNQEEISQVYERALGFVEATRPLSPAEPGETPGTKTPGSGTPGTGEKEPVIQARADTTETSGREETAEP